MTTSAFAAGYATSDVNFDSTGDLVALDADHPGFRDADYRERRNAIARAALERELGDPVPRIPYTPAEHAVWRTVCDHLRPLHARRVHPVLQGEVQNLGLLDGDLPQLVEVNRELERTGFRMEPVAGLVVPRAFLEALGERIFLSTQYVRHGSKPLYTPEPDVIHELVGHAACLHHPALAALNAAFGGPARAADEVQILRLVRVYWWTLEFGLVREGDQIWALGAGLLSSAGELAGIDDGPAWRPWDLDAMAETAFDPTQPNPVLFVAPGLERMVVELTDWLAAQPGGSPRA